MKLTMKGQVTIPADVRRDLNITYGEELDFVKDEKTKKYYLKKIQVSNIDEWVGKVKKDTKQFMADIRG